MGFATTLGQISYILSHCRLQECLGLGTFWTAWLKVAPLPKSCISFLYPCSRVDASLSQRCSGGSWQMELATKTDVSTRRPEASKPFSQLPKIHPPMHCTVYTQRTCRTSLDPQSTNVEVAKRDARTASTPRKGARKGLTPLWSPCQDAWLRLWIDFLGH